MHDPAGPSLQTHPRVMTKNKTTETKRPMKKPDRCNFQPRIGGIELKLKFLPEDIHIHACNHLISQVPPSHLAKHAAQRVV